MGERCAELARELRAVARSMPQPGRCLVVLAADILCQLVDLRLV